MMVTFVPAFISDAVRTYAGSGDPPRATLADVADHIEHIRDLAGVDHVGIGSDFDGISDTPIGLEDVSTFPLSPRRALPSRMERGGPSEAGGRECHARMA